MKRIFLGFALCVGMLLTGVVDAAAGGYCSLDPTVPVGLPVHVNVDVKVSLLGTSTHVYASNSQKSTTFGGVLGLP